MRQWSIVDYLTSPFQGMGDVLVDVLPRVVVGVTCRGWTEPAAIYPAQADSYRYEKRF